MLTDQQIANVVFNETRSLSGIDIDTARVNVAHAIINGMQLARPPLAAPSTAKVPDAEKAIYASCVLAVATARANLLKETGDPTDGATHFNFRKNNSRGDFQGHAIKTQIGPLKNSYPSDDLPATGIYANTYV